MSNFIYENGFYNEYQKQRYLNTLPEKSVSNSARILSRPRKSEEMYAMDLFNFDLHQIELLLSYLNPSTINASRSNFYIVRSYIRWGIEQDLRDNNLNPLETLGKTSYFKRFIDNSKKTLFTKEEIDLIIDTCVNAQDSVVVKLIFDGAFGTADYEELLNLKRESILRENILELEDGDKLRKIEVSVECMKLVNKSLAEQTYFKKNGNASARLKSGPVAKLNQNNYVLRNVETRNKYTEKGHKHLVLRRIDAVREYNELNVLTPHMIRNSGMLYMAKCLLEEHGELNNKQLEIIYKQFGDEKGKNNGYDYYHDSRYTDDFLNIETINRMYGKSNTIKSPSSE